MAHDAEGWPLRVGYRVRVDPEPWEGLPLEPFHGIVEAIDGETVTLATLDGRRYAHPGECHVVREWQWTRRLRATREALSLKPRPRRALA